jgi:hypothetical protein
LLPLPLHLTLRLLHLRLKQLVLEAPALDVLKVETTGLQRGGRGELSHQKNIP